MWQALRSELHPKGFELVTVGLDALGAAGCRAFIEAAAATLVPGGRLIMVANRNLPYEERLSALFRHYEMLADEGGFKVLLAIR